MARAHNVYARYNQFNGDPVTGLSDALAALGRLPLLSFKIIEKTAVTRLPKLDQHQRRILDALRVSLPAK